MESISRYDDEYLKRLMGAPDPARSDGAFIVYPNRAEEMRAHFAKNYFRPSKKNISSQRVRRFLQENNIAMVVPMCEQGPVTRSLLGTVKHLIPAHHIYVIDNGSDDEARDEVRQHGARLVDAEAVLDCLNWDRLLPLLALEDRPTGKGVAVLAGYLLLYFLAEYTGEAPAWICQHDSEIRDYHSYRGLEYLAWGALERKDAHYVKIAKKGRENETTMMTRLLLRKLARLSHDPSVQKRMNELFMRIAPHKWMLTGEFMLRRSLAWQRLFASGYLEETLISAFAEDLGAVIGCHTIQVANPNPRLDAPNTTRKDAFIFAQICGFILELGHEVIPTNRWTLEDIARFNHQRMSEPEEAAWIPKDEGPVDFDEFENNRILPSIAMLNEGGFINKEEASVFMERFLSETAA